MIEVSPVSGFVPYSEYGSGSRGAVEADVMKFFLKATNNKMTGVEYGRYNDHIIVGTDRRADNSSITKHHRYRINVVLFLCVVYTSESGNPLEKPLGAQPERS